MDYIQFGPSVVAPVNPALAALLKEAKRKWDAHHRRWAYMPLPPLIFNGHVRVDKDGNRVHERKPVRHYYCSPIDRGRYPTPAVRELRAQRGCGKARRPDTQMRSRVNLPWNTSMARVIAFDIVNEADGTRRLGDVKVFRGGIHSASKQRRDYRLENALTDEQWLSLYKAVARKVFSA